ncbi:hypothetical protein I4U23_025888 [Adineta vaga]|nr:hypothetical protein I4U23_025888 [Adineta vaga]
MSKSSFDTLPIEILHQICNYLDCETIFFSLRSVCKRFYSVANSYHDYNFNFESISKENFHLLCQMIPFQQVVSLTLSNKDQTHGQISLFLSLFNLNQFTRLRSLKLLHIAPDHLNVLLTLISQVPLTSLSIHCQIFTLQLNTALNLLSATIEQSFLEKLDLHMFRTDVPQFQWPKNSALKHLRIRHSLTLEQFYFILECSPYLEDVILKDFNVTETSFHYSKTFLQLKSLICTDGYNQMNKLDECLSWTPSLVHLKLVGHGSLFNSVFDGYRWEQLITTKLPLLNKFEVFLWVLTDVHYDTNNIEEIVSSFRTQFWLENIHCSLICDYITYLHKLILYSIPICYSYFQYYSTKSKVSVTNFMKTDDNATEMDHVK